jgi:hypothetical protein
MGGDQKVRLCKRKKRQVLEGWGRSSFNERKANGLRTTRPMHAPQYQTNSEDLSSGEKRCQINGVEKRKLLSDDEYVCCDIPH